MAVGLATGLRNARLDQITAKIDLGAAAGKLRIYNSPRPATGGTITSTLLAELVFSDPSAGAAAGGTLTMNAITQDSMADNSGTALWARVIDSDGNFVADMSVTAVGGGGDVQLNSTTIVAGGVVQVNSATFTDGNA